MGRVRQKEPRVKPARRSGRGYGAKDKGQGGCFCQGQAGFLDQFAQDAASQSLGPGGTRGAVLRQSCLTGRGQVAGRMVARVHRPARKDIF